VHIYVCDNSTLDSYIYTHIKQNHPLVHIYTSEHGTFDSILILLILKYSDTLDSKCNNDTPNAILGTYMYVYVTTILFGSSILAKTILLILFCSLFIQ